jgi:tRNA-specific 2-thiouridylase
MSKVVVAMSGGVDSSVAAALLKQQGHEVVGMMLRLWSEPGREDANRCCTPDSLALARRVAARLEIPFYVVDAKQVFRQTVVQYFLDGYTAGTTPNPCLLCNRVIRWEFLLQHAEAIGAEKMATGHYVRLDEENGIYSLRRAVDPAKDQSYVLHVLDQAKLARSLFPIGGYTKAEVRALATSFQLPTAVRADSQDLCFLGGEDYRAFLRRTLDREPVRGPIVRQDGRQVGEHQGLAFYTIGQRKGLGIASSVPLYVLAKEAASNTLVVGGEDELGSRRLTAVEVTWMSGQPPAGPFRAEVKTRYTARPAAAEVLPLEQGRRVEVTFDAAQRDLTAGQSAVFYQDDRVLGGGRIL